MEYFYVINGGRQGPVSDTELKSLFEAGRISADTLIWSESFSDWTSLSAVFQWQSAATNSSCIPELPVSMSSMPFGYKWPIFAYIPTAIISALPALFGAIVAFYFVAEERPPRWMVPYAGMNYMPPWMLIAILSLGLISGIAGMIYLFKAWKRLGEHSRQSITPGKALGFMFIPVFNFYWMFRAIYSWSKEYNSIVSSRQNKVSEKKMLLFCIFAILLPIFVQLQPVMFKAYQETGAIAIPFLYYMIKFALTAGGAFFGIVTYYSLAKGAYVLRKSS